MFNNAAVPHVSRCPAKKRGEAQISLRQGKTPITMAPDINVRKERLRKPEAQNGRVQWLSDAELQDGRRAEVASS
jgi:hypothetical protein